jgi:energy-coupling factor transporter ATP-binding protein EcfA2
MKIAKIQIENFRHLGGRGEPFTLDFTDALGRVRDFTLFVGPNASGKTTILDAIAAALGPGLGMPTLRAGFQLSPHRVVHRGALHAKVTCCLRFSPEEITATQNLFRLAEDDHNIPDMREVQLTWTYPDPRKPSGFTSGPFYSGYVPALTSGFWSPASGQALMSGTLNSGLVLSGSVPAFSVQTGPQPPLPQGYTEYEPELGWAPLAGRFVVAQLLSTGRADWTWYDRLGGVFTFDQERTGLGKTVSRQVWNIIRGTTESAREKEELRTTDPRTILIDLALQSLVPEMSSTGKRSDEFRQIQERYAHICAPRKLVGAVRDSLGEFEVNFSDGENEYNYEGLSSGEKNVLLLLIRFVAERIHRSVVMIDELELNQHPIWQRKLLHMLPKMGEDNQIIATTHSPYLRDAVRPDAVIDLGALDDHGKQEPR